MKFNVVLGKEQVKEIGNIMADNILAAIECKKSNETSHSNKIKLTFEERNTIKFNIMEQKVIKNQVESSKKDIKDIGEMVEEQERIIKKQDQIINYISSFLLIP